MVAMTRPFWLLLIVAAFVGSNSQELGTEENPLPDDEDEDDGEDLTVEHMHTLHDHLDGNKDGKVSMKEVLEFHSEAKKAMAKHEIEEVFNEIESTKDGSLSLAEHMADVEPALSEEAEGEEKAKVIAHEKEKFAAADASGDGTLTVDELVHLMNPPTNPEVLDVHVKEELRKKDADGDGTLSSSEWGEEADAVAAFADVDSNKDGVVDKEELKHLESGDLHTENAMTKLFEDADQDGDGHVSKEEMGKVVGKMDDHPAQFHIYEWVFHYLKILKSGFSGSKNKAEM
jgi:Ca2+-binding EF-hand superfamily protein